MNDSTLNKKTEGFQEVNGEILTVQNVRIFRPSEAKKFIKAITKKENRTNFEALLYSGMRYVEAQRLLEKPQMFEPENRRIHLDSYAIRKKKIKIKERYVILNPIGVRVIEAFIEQNHQLPNYGTWRENLKRWARLAGLDDRRLSPKTTRKTYEGWLVTSFPAMTNIVFISQGHSDMVALKHYVTLPFSPQDKLDMKEFVYGWEP